MSKVWVYKFQLFDAPLTDPRMGTADAIDRIGNARRIDHEAVEVDTDALDEDGFMPRVFPGGK